MGCQVLNNTNTIQYIGIALNSGSILVHECSLSACLNNAKNSDMAMDLFHTLNDKKNEKKSQIKLVDAITLFSAATISIANKSPASFLFRQDVVIGHTPNVELIMCRNYDGFLLMKNQTYLKVVLINDTIMTPKLITEIVNDKSSMIKRSDITQRTNPLVNKLKISGPARQLEDVNLKQRDFVFI